MRRVIPILAVLGLATLTDAHPLDLGYMTVTSEGEHLTAHLELDLTAASIVLATETPDAATISAHAADLAARTFERAPVQTPGGPCTWAPATASLSARTASIVAVATCPPGARTWAFPVVTEAAITPRFQLMVKETSGASERLTLIDKTARPLELVTSAPAAEATTVGFTRFLRSGIAHIGVAPSEWRSAEGHLQLPDGIDHIMFLLALMLGGGTLLQLIGIASGFTIGHSITLALSALNIVRPPSSVIEPLIALTIAFAALEAFTGKLKAQRWKIAGAFGLIHGFAFATALSHVELTLRGKLAALFGYNLGVEIGQVIVVLITAPIVMYAYRHARIGRPAIKVAAALIFGCGVYWFITRAFF
ncbi:hypothetical protein BH11MYX1_BH11MYX1_41210 [soil metagenome]